MKNLSLLFIAFAMCAPLAAQEESRNNNDIIVVPKKEVLDDPYGPDFDDSFEDSAVDNTPPAPNTSWPGRNVDTFYDQFTKPGTYD